MANENSSSEKKIRHKNYYDQIGLLFDAAECIGCGKCYAACKTENSLPETNKDFLKDHLSNNTYTAVEDYSGIYARKMCMHCSEPACVSVCPVGAFKKTELGPVLYDAEKCIGCRYCMQACPHNVPRYEWESRSPRVRKCILCYERLKKGELTACAEACPVEATICGKLKDLIRIAKKRLQNYPEKYYQHIYGLEEAGGSNVLIISPVPFEQLGYSSKVPMQSMPSFTMQAMEKIPTAVSVGGIFLTSMYWLTKRKNQIAREEKIEKGKEK
jgi:formate dehydrogenase iron-sulfur subunit